MLVRSVITLLHLHNGIQLVLNNQVKPFILKLSIGSYVPWPSEDAIRRGRLAQLALEGLVDGPAPIEEEKSQETEIEETKGPRRNPGRRATSVDARRRKMSEVGEPKPIREREKERDMELELDLFNPDEEI